MKSKNVTLSFDQELLFASRRYAKVRGTSLNKLLRNYLMNTVLGKESEHSAHDFFDALDGAAGDSKGKRWSREDAYSR